MSDPPAGSESLIAKRPSGPAAARVTRLERRGDLWWGGYAAMAGPCELQVELADGLLAGELLQLAAAETWRIEDKYSRYREGSIVHRINAAAGEAVEVDA